jgi:hypothetical protein
MKKIIHKIGNALLQVCAVGGLCLLAYSAVLKHHNNRSIPTPKEIRRADNIDEASSLHDAALISRMSTVKVLSVSPEDYGISRASGTYVTYNDRYFVLTVAHGTNPDCSLVRIMAASGGGELIECKQIIEINPYVDYAIVEVDKIDALDAVDIRRQLPTTQEWINTFATFSELLYTGYPSDIGIATVRGEVISYGYEDVVYMHSFAWPGASGSGVFNEQGQLVGHIMALLVGETGYGIDVLEDIVVVVPLFSINWSIVSHR